MCIYICHKKKAWNVSNEKWARPVTAERVSLLSPTSARQGWLAYYILHETFIFCVLKRCLICFPRLVNFCGRWGFRNEGWRDPTSCLNCNKKKSRWILFTIHTPYSIIIERIYCRELSSRVLKPKSVSAVEFNSTSFSFSVQEKSCVCTDCVLNACDSWVWSFNGS